jgi:diguanylate cyclase (GGDEF) domain
MGIFILIAVISFFSFYKQLRQRDGKSFFIICLNDLFTLSLDIFTWSLDGQPGTFVHNMDILVTQFYFVFTTANSFLILFYILSKARFSNKTNKFYVYLSISAFFSYLALLFILYPFNLIYYIDENNYYHHGNLYWITYLYYFFFSILNFFAIMTNRRDFKFRMLLSFSVLSVVPFISLIIQMGIYNLIPNTFSYGLFAIAIYLVFVNNQEFAVQDARYDKMTGVYNRSTYLDMLDNEFRDLKSCGVVFYDINNLKYMNDTYGHAVGDQAIIRVANSLKVNNPANAYSFRIGGDEFVTIFKDCTKEDIEKFLFEWKNNLADIIKNDQYKIDVAYGYSYAKGTFLIDRLIKEADTNMYSLKKKIKETNNSEKTVVKLTK